MLYFLFSYWPAKRIKCLTEPMIIYVRNLHPSKPFFCSVMKHIAIRNTQVCILTPKPILKQEYETIGVKAKQHIA